MKPIDRIDIAIVDDKSHANGFIFEGMIAYELW